ncbi:MAG: hypothetical protein IJ391_01010 [Clostridia bacterium]|nr:hypothetical protein [Clostridia bacterium]
MTLTEKVAYLKGLIEGLQIDESKPENKIIKAMVDVIDDLALTVTDLEDEVDALDEYIEEIDDDLAAIEDIAYEDDDYEDDEDVEDDEFEEWDEDDDEEDSEFYEVMCPHCGEVVYLDDDIDPTCVTCPACINKFDITEDACSPEDCEGCSGCSDK